MKRIVIALLALIICMLNISAREKYSLTAKVGSGIPMSIPHITPFTIEAMAHYNLTSHWAFGAGTGYGQYDNISTIPLYANVKYTIRPQAKYNMFANCSAGYGFAIGDKKDGGFYLNPEFGVQRKFWNKTFSIAVGYQWQDLERLKSNTDNYVSSKFVESLSAQAITFKIGIMF